VSPNATASATITPHTITPDADALVRDTTHNHTAYLIPINNIQPTPQSHHTQSHSIFNSNKQYTANAPTFLLMQVMQDSIRDLSFLSRSLIKLIIQKVSTKRPPPPSSSSRQVGDQVLEVNGVPTDGLTLEQVCLGAMV